MKFFSVLLKSLRFLTIVALTASLMVTMELTLKPQIAFSGFATPGSTSRSPESHFVFPVQSVPPTAVRASYGHLPYQEDEPARLQTVGQFIRNNAARREAMDVEAVQAFREMSIAAKTAGVSLMPISGFRTNAVQATLFAQQIARRGSKKAAAKWSAPPGYSEHHTGYAIDIADRQRPGTDLSTSFQQTPAYRWLVANAANYGFELSFPPNNWQGIGYEPWHWRYVGSARAGQVFATAKRFQSKL